MKARLPLVAVNGVLIVAAGMTVFPLLWMLSVSLMPSGSSSVFPPPLWPDHPTLANYRELFAQQQLGRYFLNSLIVASGAMIERKMRNSPAPSILAASISSSGIDRAY